MVRLGKPTAPNTLREHADFILLGASRFDKGQVEKLYSSASSNVHLMDLSLLSASSWWQNFGGHIVCPNICGSSVVCKR